MPAVHRLQKTGEKGPGCTCSPVKKTLTNSQLAARAPGTPPAETGEKGPGCPCLPVKRQRPWFSTRGGESGPREGRGVGPRPPGSTAGGLAVAKNRVSEIGRRVAQKTRAPRVQTGEKGPGCTFPPVKNTLPNFQLAQKTRAPRVHTGEKGPGCTCPPVKNTLTNSQLVSRAPGTPPAKNG